MVGRGTLVLVEGIVDTPLGTRVPREASPHLPRQALSIATRVTSAASLLAPLLACWPAVPIVVPELLKKPRWHGAC